MNWDKIKQKLELVFLFIMMVMSFIFYVWFISNNAIFLGVVMLGVFLLSAFEFCNDYQGLRKRSNSRAEKLI